MVDASVIRSEALMMGAEDYYGLYDLLLSLPAPDDPATLRAAVSALGQMVQEGLVALYLTQWTGNRFDPIPAARTQAILADPASWKAPEPGSRSECVAFTNTDRGDRLYASKGEPQGRA